MNTQPKRRIVFFVVLALLLVATIYYNLTLDRTLTVSYSTVCDLFDKRQVEAFSVKDGTLKLKLRTAYDGETTVKHALASVDRFDRDLGELISQQRQDGTLSSYNYVPKVQIPWYVRVLPYLLAFLLVGVLIFFLYARLNANGNNGMARFSKANVRVGAGKKKVCFSDVAGADEEKAELQEIVDFLREPDKFRRLGARIPKGVLLVGPPGTGKTLIAKAVAGEASVQFLSISGSDFVELYVGVGASRVRDLFDQAKKNAPSIIFIDEIDAVGRRRGAGLGGGHDEREQTLNQLLVEMDGFESADGVIVLAATNRQDILDSALLRPGRFDRQVFVNPPDVKGREEILRVHARNKPLAEDVDLKAIARATGGFTGADLENLLNEAALYAAHGDTPLITMKALESSVLKVIAGPEKRSYMQLERDRRITAYHEAGHAVAMYHLPTQDPVHQITIVPRGKALGLTISLPEEDSLHVTRNQMREQVISLLGGRVAEQLVFDDISTGASNDLQRATRLAHDMIAKFGMSKQLGPVSFDTGDEVFIGRDYERTKAYSERTGGEIDDEIRRVLEAAYERCAQLLRENREKLDTIAAFLLKKETMSRGQFEACMKGEPIPEDAEDFFE